MSGTLVISPKSVAELLPSDGQTGTAGTPPPAVPVDLSQFGPKKKAASPKTAAKRKIT